MARRKKFRSKTNKRQRLENCTRGELAEDERVSYLFPEGRKQSPQKDQGAQNRCENREGPRGDGKRLRGDADTGGKRNMPLRNMPTSKRVRQDLAVSRIWNMPTENTPDPAIVVRV